MDELRGSQVKTVGQKRSGAGRGKRRGGHFPRSGTKQRLESVLGLIVGQPRRNAPFLTHDHQCIPCGGITRGERFSALFLPAALDLRGEQNLPDKPLGRCREMPGIVVQG
jgi:hypothetical protein